MRQEKSEVPTFDENVSTFPKNDNFMAGGRMADCLSAKIIVPARAFVNYSASKTVCQAFIVPARAFVNGVTIVTPAVVRIVPARAFVNPLAVYCIGGRP